MQYTNLPIANVCRKYNPITVEELTKNKFRELIEEVDELIIQKSNNNNNVLNLSIGHYDYLNDETVRRKLTASLRERGFSVKYASTVIKGPTLTITWNIPSLEEN